MKLKRGACIMAALIALVAGAADALAASHLDTPLLVVRFNQPRVYYQQPLYNVVAKALQAKPAVVFNIVSVIPVTGNAEQDEKLNAVSQNNTGELVQTMLQMGVPQERVRVSYQQGGVETNEIHIFVQ